MKIGRSAAYAIIATGYIAQQPEKKTILSHDISKEYDIPLEYLLKILQQLVRRNILRSKRGPRGGFTLARPASKITMLQILEIVDGPMVNHMTIVEHTGKTKFGITKSIIGRPSQSTRIFPSSFTDCNETRLFSLR